MTDHGAQPQRTGLAWQRTAIGAGGCALLLLHSAVRDGGGMALVPPVLAAVAAVSLAFTGRVRERQLSRSAAPSAVSAALAATASFAVAATAVATLILGWSR